MNNTIRQYRFTYDSDNQTSIVQQEASSLPDMEFRVHNSDLPVLYPEVIKNLVPMNTVEENMKAFTKRDVEGAKAARKSKIEKCRYRISIPL